MNEAVRPVKFYHNRINSLKSATDKLKNTRSTISWARLLIIGAAIASVVWLWPEGFSMILLVLIPLLTLFGFLVSRSLKLDEQILHNKNLIQICGEEILELEGKHVARFDGSSYLQATGISGNDLDIFGPAGLYPFVSRINTEKGRDMFAHWLTVTTDKETIISKQEAVSELADQTLWRQQLQGYGMRSAITNKSQEIIEQWQGSKDSSFQGPVWKVLRFLIPAISITTAFMYWQDRISDQSFNIIMLLILGFAFWIGKLISVEYSKLSGVVKELEALGNLLHVVESTTFKSQRLRLLQEQLTGNLKASRQIHELRKILNRLDYRLNPLVYIPLSVFMLWDLQQSFALEKWKRTMQGRIGNWYQCIAEFECISSLGNLSFNHPGWAMPEISDQWFVLVGDKMGHPLIHPSKSVMNNLKMDGTGTLIMLTGSNMAGKSTFLRTLGTNMILAMTGAPVCASYFKVPVVHVMSSMRIMDNLEEETSTFYAELKKLKTILEAVQRREKIFILLDEMLRGTNAIDRHTGSVALIHQLLRYDAVGIIASHDISLTAMAETYPDRIQNFHFDSEVINNEIVFDYKLKPGICTSTNATLLMKKIGIQIDETKQAFNV